MRVSDLDIMTTARFPRGAGAIPPEGVQPHAGPGSDRRVEPRVTLRAPAQLTDAAGTTVVQTRDASAAGAAFVSVTGVPPARHRFRLRLPDGQIVDVGCTVERGTPNPRGLFEGYAKFDHPVDVFSHKRIRPRVA